MTFDDDSYVVCTFDVAHDDLRLYWRDSGGKPYGNFTSLQQGLKAAGRKLVFAMNAGMYQTDLRPVGLYIEDGKPVRRANTRDGEGNFHLKPHGEQPRRAVQRELATLKGRARAGAHRLPGQMQQIERAGQTQRVIGVRHGEQQRGDAEGGADHVDDEADADAGQRNEARRTALRDRARDEIDHVRAGR